MTASKFGAGRPNLYSITGMQEDDEDTTVSEEDGVFKDSSNFKPPSLPGSKPRPSPYFNFLTFCFPDTEYQRYKYRRWRMMLAIAGAFLIATIIFLAVFATESLVIKHTGYKFIQQTYIPEVDATVLLYVHKKTGAEILTLVPDDETQDAVFGVSVRTLPQTNGGAAHVLMESVWDGSEGYPLKDPVQEYEKGSLSTYLKAMCLGDRTLFTAASRQRSDFSNLVSLLLDGLFQPLVITKPEESRWIFREEAWRLDPGLIFNGVVLNRQRAIYSDPEELLHRYARKALFKDIHLQFDAQGDPEEMIELRPIDVLNLYDKHYLPTNMQVFLYGPIREIFDGMYIFDSYAKTHTIHQDKKDKSALQFQSLNMKSHAEESHEYPLVADEDDAGECIMMSWILNEGILTRKEEYAWRVIDHLLLGTPASILRKELGDMLDLSNYNHNSTVALEVIGGLETTYQQWRYSVGVKGVPKEKVSSVFDSIHQILASIKVFDEDALAAAMNVVEMGRYDMSSGKTPRGITMFHRVLEHWTYGISPYDSYAFASSIKLLKDEIKDNGSDYFVALLDRSVVENMHMVKVELTPSHDTLSTQANKEKQRVQHLKDTMSAENFQKLLDDSKYLEEVITTPESPQAYDHFPRLAIENINATNSPQKGHVSEVKGGVVLATNVVPSSFGMVFVDFGLDMSNVDFDDVPILPLVFRIMLEAGTSQYSNIELINQIGRLSTGIKAEAMIVDVRSKDDKGPLQFQVHDGQHLATKMVFRGRCMAENLDDYLDLLGEIAFHNRGFDKFEVVEVLNRMIQEFESNVQRNGPEMVSHRLASRYSNIGVIEERLYGFKQLAYLHKLLQDVHSKWDSISAKLQTAQAAIVEGNRNGMFMSITAEDDLMSAAKSSAKDFIANSIPAVDASTPFGNPGEAAHPWIPKIQQTHQLILEDEALIVATPVDHVGKGGILYDARAPIDGSTAVVARYLEKFSLYEKLRERRGVGAVKVDFNFRDGTLFVMTEDDIHVASTLDVIDEAANALIDAVNRIDYLPAGAAEAIAGAIGEWDGTAKQPDQIGWDFMVAFYRDDNADFEQLYRDQIFNTTRDNFADFAMAFKDWKKSSVALVSSAATYLSVRNDTHFVFFRPICQHTNCMGPLQNA